MEDKVVAIILAAGQGKRMGSSIPKQYLLIDKKPVLYYTVEAFEKSNVDEIILVVGDEERDACSRDLVAAYGFRKVSKIVVGGKERYESVYEGLQEIESASYVLIHDGARPCITSSIINRTIEEVEKCQACVVGVPSKDTIKVVDSNHIVVDTPERSSMWMVQTPQAFEFNMVKGAYEALMQAGITNVTDDAMVVERMSSCSITMIEGSYMNIKVTTPEDLPLASLFLKLL